MSNLPQITILAFSPIQRDARVLRQIEYLAQAYSITVVGYGQLAQPIHPAVRMCSIEPDNSSVNAQKFRNRTLLLLGKVMPSLGYETWYWSKSNHRSAYEALQKSKAHLIHANDWNALPVAYKAAQQSGARFVLDLHEYAPLEAAQRRTWYLYQKPMIEYFLRKYGRFAAATITVNQTIAEKYIQEYAFQPIVIMNAPQQTQLPIFRPVNPACIRLVHHGVPNRDRQLELMIQAVALADDRYILDLILVDSTDDYLLELKALAARLAPNRIHFLPPVPPAEIVTRLTEYDMGFYLLPPVNFNNMAALPNKFFDFVSAGLAVCIGPSQEMARLTRQWGLGVVAESFDSAVVAATLNKLTATEIERMKRQSLEAGKSLNANIEMAKLQTLYAQLLHQ